MGTPRKKCRSSLKPITSAEIFGSTSKHKRTMHRSMVVPDMTQSYSLCVEFVRMWFLDIINDFHEDFFKTVNLNGNHIFNDMRSLDKKNLLKRPKPAVMITPSIDFGFSNDNLDVMMFGFDVYAPTGRYKDSFFDDNVNNLHLGIGLQTNFLTFNFGISLPTKAQQLDLFQYIRYAFRMGSSFGEDIDMDFHIPYSLMVQIALDAGFEVQPKFEDDDYPRIKNIQKFIKYLNRHSSLPFLYKFRTINGHNEFFLRMQRMYVHLKSTDISADDGERVGHLMDNFNIELTVEVRFPAPKFYAYYSENDHNLHKVYSVWNTDRNITSIYAFSETKLPQENQMHWPMLMHMTYEEEDLSKPLEIDFSEFFENDIDIKVCIDSCISKAMSPSIFIDFLIVNGRERLNGTINWNKMIFTSNDLPISNASFIAIYIDNSFIDNFLIESREAYDNRINSSTKHPDDQIENAKKNIYRNR